MTSDYLSSIGLGLDIIGVALVFCFGLPPSIYKAGPDYFTWGTKRYNWVSWIALILLVLGFLLQIISNHI